MDSETVKVNSNIELTNDAPIASTFFPRKREPEQQDIAVENIPRKRVMMQMMKLLVQLHQPFDPAGGAAMRDERRCNNALKRKQRLHDDYED